MKEKDTFSFEQLLLWGVMIPTSKVGFGTIDFVLYPFLIYQWGFVQATIAVSLFLLVLSYLMLLLYEWAKKDLFAIECFKKQALERTNNAVKGWTIASFAFRIMGENAWIFLVWFYQPYKVVIFHRHSNYYYKISSRDIECLCAFWVIRSIYWAGFMYFGQSIFVMLWEKIT